MLIIFSVMAYMALSVHGWWCTVICKLILYDKENWCIELVVMVARVVIRIPWVKLFHAAGWPHKMPGCQVV